MQAQPRLGPANPHQPAGGGKTHGGIAHVRAAKCDVGGQKIIEGAHGKVAGLRVDGRDTGRLHQRCNRHPAGLEHRQRIEHHPPGEACDRAARHGLERCGRDLARAGDVEGQQQPLPGERHIDGAPIGREANPVRAIERIDRRPDAAAVGTGIEEAALVAVVMAGLAEVGEPETALGIEHDVVGTAQAVAVAAVVEPVDAAGCKVDPLDAPGLVIGGLVAGDPEAAHLAPRETAVVADIERAIGSEGCAIGAAARSCNRLLASVRVDTRDPPGCNLDKEA